MFPRLLLWLSGPALRFVLSNYKIIVFGLLVGGLVIMQNTIAKRDRIISQQLSELVSVKQKLVRSYYSYDSLAIASHVQRDSLQRQLYEANRDLRMLRVFVDDFSKNNGLHNSLPDPSKIQRKPK